MVKNIKSVLLILSLLSLPVLSVAQEVEKKSSIKLGGALRYNLFLKNFESGVQKTNPKFTWDTWRFNADASIKGIDLSFEYRFYPSSRMHFIKHGYFGYKFSDMLYTKLGVTLVPFGILDNASHGFFLQALYHIGLEEDYDMGLNFEITPNDNIDIAVAYFRQPSLGGSAQGAPLDVATFSYNIVSGEGAYVNDNGDIIKSQATLSELNQFNARIAWRFIDGWEAGLSGQIGGIYNHKLDKSEISGACAAHLVGNFWNFNLKTQFTYYKYNAKDDMGNKLDVVQMGAFGAAYPGGAGYSGGVAAEGNVYSIALSYDIPVNWGPISNIRPYVDYSYVDKANKLFYNTHHLMPGFEITAGPIYTYIEYALGKNQPIFTDDYGKGLGTGIKDAKWNARFNINMGYYF